MITQINTSGKTKTIVSALATFVTSKTCLLLNKNKQRMSGKIGNKNVSEIQTKKTHNSIFHLCITSYKHSLSKDSPEFGRNENTNKHVCACAVFGRTKYTQATPQHTIRTIFLLSSIFSPLPTFLFPDLIDLLTFSLSLPINNDRQLTNAII